jgi:hypothetical protein
MRLIVRDIYSEKRYEFEIFEETTAQDIIDTLIDLGFIGPSPREGYQWILTDSKFIQILPNEKLSSRLSPGENKVYLAARAYTII